MVVMILTLLVISMGFVIFGRVFHEAANFPDRIDDHCEKYLDILLKDTDYAFCSSKITVPSGKSASTWLGIVNGYDQDICYTIDSSDVEAESNPNPVPSVSTLPLTILQNQKSNILVKVSAGDAPKGEYVATLKIHLKQTSSSRSCDLDSADYPASDNPTVVTRKLFIQVT